MLHNLVYDYIDVTQLDKYVFSYLLRCVFNISPNIRSRDVKPFILQRWRIVCVCVGQFGVGLRE